MQQGISSPAPGRATDELVSRSRPISTETYNEALRAVSAEIPNGTPAMLERLAHAVLELTAAQSAGITMLCINSCGKEGLRLGPIVGALQSYSGTELSLECPCGYVVRSSRKAEFFREPQAIFEELKVLPTPIRGSLCAPITSQDRTIGTLWAMSHDQPNAFTQEDLTMLTNLAKFAGAALPIAEKYHDYAVESAE